MTDSEVKSLKELVGFLQIGARLDLKDVALEHVLGVTGTDEGVKTLVHSEDILVSLISLLDDGSVPIAKQAALTLVNISASEKGAEALIELDVAANCPPLQKPPENLVHTTLKFIIDPASHIADQCCMILSNLSRPSHLVDKVIDKLEESKWTFDEIIKVFTRNHYNQNGATLHYLGPVLSNLSQSKRIRKYILDPQKVVIQRLLSFTEFDESVIRRGGVIGTLKNCCFESEFHEWLLSEEVDMLPRLLLPLAGNEEFDEEDNDKLPIDLQYLPKDKVRDDDPDIRCMLIEAITQLCTERSNREFIRDKNTYVILRELHKREKDKKVLLACQNLVDILIRTEDEIGHENLKNVEVPEDLQSQFENADKEYLSSV